MTTLLAVLGLGFVSALILTPLVRKLAFRWDIVDRPDGHRKLHAVAIPLGGGVAVFGGIVIALTALAVTDSPWKRFLFDESRFVLAMLSATGLLVVVGLLDDRFGLRGRQKLLGQIAAVLILLFAGLTIERISILDWKIELGLLAIPFTCFWLLGAINALNLIDGVDGLASSVGIILSLAVAAMALVNGHEADALIALAIAGGLTGFLCFNLPPASIFLGDAGSMLIGLSLGTLAIRCALKGPATMALAAPVAIWAIPIFDVSMAILRRKLTGRSIYTTDRGHLHHVMLRHGYSGRKTLVWISALCGLTSAGAMFSIFSNDERLALLSIAIVICTLILARIFGHSECMLLARRLSHTVRSLIPRRSHSVETHTGSDFRTRLQGSDEWEELWQRMTLACHELGLCKIQLNVHLPAIGVDYHASWSRKGHYDSSELWTTDMPIFFDGRLVGRMKFAGPASADSVCVSVSERIEGMKEFEAEVYAIFEDHQQAYRARLSGPARVPAVAAVAATPATVDSN